MNQKKIHAIQITIPAKAPDQEKTYHYQIVKVIGSVEPRVGATLKEHELRPYLNKAAWTVTIT